MRVVLFYLPFAFTLCLGAALEPCERVWRFLKAWERANLRAGFHRKQMAGYQKLSEPQLSMQLALVNNAHPSMARAALAPDVVLVNFAQELCDMSQDEPARVITDRTLDRLLHRIDMLDQQMAREAYVPEKRRA